ncbi:hypothetical protein LWC34_21330 [Kibdelosporangium philippinense]|uniref:WXG100 family type VII secretion target n=1 Tax=Kibdelosporangium philippinense TaxID=211113 RepID=A0ABS8ZF93_9PSEU|nr:hypothetical protein [Kibdelosporangium philippinense]MCE7005351.1 hypothetical protein [Kibdelosporangium philippinense]
MFDGGGSSAPSPTGSGSTFGLRINPTAIPGAYLAFHEAAREVRDLVANLQRLSQPNWAGDPVSKTTAQRFDTGDGTTGRMAAINTLTKYANELQNSGDALKEAHDRYMEVEGVNSERWRGQGFQDV